MRGRGERKLAQRLNDFEAYFGITMNAFLIKMVGFNSLSKTALSLDGRGPG